MLLSLRLTKGFDKEEIDKQLGTPACVNHINQFLITSTLNILKHRFGRALLSAIHVHLCTCDTTGIRALSLTQIFICA